MKQKTKNRVLIAGFLVIGFIAYRFAFSKTLAVKRNLNVLEEQTIGVDNILSLNASLKKKEQIIDSILKSHNLDNSSLQNGLLEAIRKSAVENNFVVTGFEEPHRFTQGGITTISYRFILTGDYKGIEQVIHTLEQQYSFGEITHIDFEKKRDYRRGKDYLECSIIVQNRVSE